jgi:hypothetical protein
MKELVIIAAVLCLGISASAALFTSDTTIGATDTNYDGGDIIVIGCTVTIEGPHTFSDVLIVENGFIKHAPITGVVGAGLNLTVSNFVVIEAGSGIVADGLGFGPGTGPGAGASAEDTLPFGLAYTNGGGGGYGGNGGSGVGGTPGGAAYSTLEDATNAGSGGGAGFGPGGAGGGIVNLNIGGALVLDGQITANGGEGLDLASGGGSGGSIAISVPWASGSGTISANGGAGQTSDGGGGGGGRINLSITNNDFTGPISAHGGTGYQNGGPGTIYVAATYAGPALVLLDNAGLAGPETPLPEIPYEADLVLTNAAAASGLSEAYLETLYVASNCVLMTGQSASIEARSLVIESNAAMLAAPVYSAGDGDDGQTLISQNESTGGGGGGLGNGGASALGAAGGAAPSRDYLFPGGLGGNSGGAGSGSVELTVDGPALINGQITANGSPGITGGSGGGGGGTLIFAATTLAGNGVISANGGAGQLPLGGGGGGGSVQIYGVTSNLFTGSMTAFGGAGATAGGAGVVWVWTNEGNSSYFICDNNGLSGAQTPFNYENEGFPDNFTVRGGAVLVIPNGPFLYTWPPLKSLLIGSNSFLSLLVEGFASISVQTNVTIEATGGITVDAQGSPPTQGKAPGGGGGNNGGMGGSGAGGRNTAIAQGDITTPSTPGQGGQFITGTSPSGGYGGGVFHFTVAGTLTLDGTISANGQNGLSSGCGGGAGGSINIQTVGFSGGGSIMANGGAGNLPNGGGGGGGLVAIHASTNQFTGAISAAGGAGFQPGGAGSLFTQIGNSQADLIFDNGGTTNGNTVVPGLDFENVTLQNGAMVTTTGIGVYTLVLRSNSFLILTNFPGPGGSIIEADDIVVGDGCGMICAAINGYTVEPAGGSLALTNGEYAGGGGANAGDGGMGLGGAPAGQAVEATIYWPDIRGGPGGAGSGSSAAPVPGGGAISVNLPFGTLELDGVLSANGASCTNGWGGGGAGGSIWLAVSVLSGHGAIMANGGAGSLPNGGGGGGGRVWIEAQSNSFSGTISACGGLGYVPGGAGTIITTGRGFPQCPQLVIDNHGLIGAETSVGGANSFAGLTVANGAYFKPFGAVYATDLIVESNAVIDVFTNRDITVAGDAQILATGAIIANGDGWDADTGPGAGMTSSNFTGSGGGYGGAGGASQGGAAGGATNGTPETPAAWGSGGGVLFGKVPGLSQGGGAIGLNVGGVLTLDGAISVNGDDAVYPGSGGGAGGSVWLTTGSLVGNGLISADGGSGQGGVGGGGGGGRIAIYSPSNNFAGSITVKGGGGFEAGGQGSIYISTNTAAAEIETVSLSDVSISQPMAPTQIDLTWSGTPGAIYQIQTSTDLVRWQPFGGSISGNSGAMNVTLTPTPGGQPQFFRVVAAN